MKKSGKSLHIFNIAIFYTFFTDFLACGGRSWVQVNLLKSQRNHQVFRLKVREINVFLTNSQGRKCLKFCWKYVVTLITCKFPFSSQDSLFLPKFQSSINLLSDLLFPISNSYISHFFPFSKSVFLPPPFPSFPLPSPHLQNISSTVRNQDVKWVPPQGATYHIKGLIPMGLVSKFCSKLSPFYIKHTPFSESTFQELSFKTTFNMLTFILGSIVSIKKVLKIKMNFSKFEYFDCLTL